ncbi:hypothetical protein ACFX1S_026677 [Malus domestica]
MQGNDATWDKGVCTAAGMGPYLSLPGVSGKGRGHVYGERDEIGTRGGSTRTGIPVTSKEARIFLVRGACSVLSGHQNIPPKFGPCVPYPTLLTSFGLTLCYVNNISRDAAI